MRSKEKEKERICSVLTPAFAQMHILYIHKSTQCVCTHDIHTSRYSETQLFSWSPSWQLIQLRPQKHWLQGSQLWNCLVWFNVAHATCKIDSVISDWAPSRDYLPQDAAVSEPWAVSQKRKANTVQRCGLFASTAEISSESLLKAVIFMKIVMLEIVNCSGQCLQVFNCDWYSLDCLRHKGVLQQWWFV